MASVFIIIMTISFIYVPIDFIWHGFHTPNDLPFRYSFIYVFIICCIAFYSAINIDKLKLKYAFIIFSILAIFLYYLAYTKFLTKLAIEINYFFLIITLLIFILYKFKHSDIGKYILVFIIFIDIILNVYQNWNIDHDKNIFMDNYISVNSAIEKIKAQDDSLYRIEKSFNQTLNDGAWYNYNGVSIFSSVAYEQMAKAQKNLGIPGNNVNSYYYKPNTPIYNSIMSIKYLIDFSKENKTLTYIDEINYHKIYKNNYYLPFAFGTKIDIKTWENNNINPFINQQEFVEKATDITDIFNKLDIEYDIDQKIFNFYDDTLYNLDNEQTNSVTLKFKAKQEGNIYLYVASYNLDHFLLNNEYYAVTTNEPYILDVGYFNKDEEIEIKINLKPEIYDINILAYQMNMDKFIEFYNNLEKNSIQITDFNNDYIEGIIESNEEKTIFTSISYDEGFSVYVDDKKVPTFKIANAFLGFDLPSGKHNIKIKYEITHLKAGLLITSISLIILIIYNIAKKRIKI